MIANHPIYESDWLSCDSLRGSHDGQSPHIRVPHLVATLIYLSHNYSYHIRGIRSSLILFSNFAENCGIFILEIVF